jgi:hypothetical protein
MKWPATLQLAESLQDDDYPALGLSIVALPRRLPRAPVALCPHRPLGVATSSAAAGAARAARLVF